MFGRRVAVLLRFPAHLQLSRTLGTPCQTIVPSFSAFALLPRSYATAQRSSNVTKEESQPVGQVAKGTPAKSASGSSGRNKKVNGAKKVIKKTEKESAAKKPAKKPKKDLSEAQQATQRKQKEKAKIETLKSAALQPPQLIQSSAWRQFVKEKSKGIPLANGTPSATKSELFAERIRDLGSQFKSLSASELEHYNHLSNTAIRAHLAEHKRWVESHSPEEIRQANLARQHLRRLLKGRKGISLLWRDVQDERQVKKPVSGFILFSTNRQRSGDFRHIAVRERMKLISQEWHALSESEKEKYQTLSAKDASRYVSEHNDVYGRMPPSASHETQAAAAAA